MSKDERSLPLSLSELRQLQWLLGCTLVLVSMGSVFFLEVETWFMVALVAAGGAATLLWPALPAFVPGWLHRLAFPIIAAVFFGDIWLTAQVLPSLIRLALLLLFYRSLCYRTRREDLQLILLGLFLLVVAGVLTVSIAFVVQLLLFSACALGLMLVITMADSADELVSQKKIGSGGTAPSGRSVTAPAWVGQVRWWRLLGRVRETLDWRFAVLGGVLFAGVVAVTALIFVAIPRFQFENSFFLERFLSRKAKTGFSETVRFGDVAEIAQDNSLALSVDLSDPRTLPATPYFRMLVLDEYTREGSFKLSARTRQELMSTERNVAVLRGTQRMRMGAVDTWTLYLEAGVSRFLPLPGSFELLRLREPHPLQFSGKIQVAALRADPLSMTAYRLDNPRTLAQLQDPGFALKLRYATREANGRYQGEARFCLDLPEGTDLRERLERVLKAWGADGDLGAAEFSKRLGEKLAGLHAYSLAPQIPPGAGDPLLRWVESKESGHCELFAGAFVLLARAAGHPARVVVGFKGGSWNAFSNSLTVRNSDAHAWCEIWDGRSAWLRVDPTPGSAVLEEQASVTADPRVRRLDSSWNARFNSVRVFWYRRIVNFDQRTQMEAVQNAKAWAQVSRKWLIENTDTFLRRLKDLVMKPWTIRRTLIALAVISLISLGVWGWTQHQTRWRWKKRSRRSDKKDPVRREAAHWLHRLGWNPDQKETGPTVAENGIPDLLRLRYGSRETWPDAAEAFRRARIARKGRASATGSRFRG